MIRTRRVGAAALATVATVTSLTVAGSAVAGSTVPVGDAGDLGSIGLWDDGPCDESLDPLRVGLQTTFASPLISLEDSPQALEAAAVAFNARGGANGACIEVVTCDENADPNKALECVRTLDEAGVVATINDTIVVAGDEVGAGYADAGISRFAINPSSPDFNDTNSYPFDAGGTGAIIMLPHALLDDGLTKFALVRADVPTATGLAGLLTSVYEDAGFELVLDAPVPAGTTDYTQFILAAEDAGAEGLLFALGYQEAIQVLQAAERLDSSLIMSLTAGTFAAAPIAELGDYAQNVVVSSPMRLATYDDPVVDVLAADLAASGIEALERENLKASPMRSWIGLYALLYLVREDGMTEFDRAAVKEMIDGAGEIPMLGLTEDWTPVTDHEGAFLRTGNGYFSYWVWDGDLENFELIGEADFDETICGTPLGGPCAS